MKNIIPRFLLSVGALLSGNLFGAVSVPPSDITPLASGTVLGRTSAGSGRAEVLTAGDGVVIANGQISAPGGSGGAPSTATYITQTPNATLVNEQALSLLATGIMQVTTGTGLVSSLPVIPIGNGGLGVSLSDPNADRILFWDDSAGSFAYLTVGSGLSITGTTISSTGGSGTVTSASVTTANGVSATVINQPTTPAFTFTLGAITPTTVNALVVSQPLGGVVLAGLTLNGTGDNSALIQAAYPAGVPRHVTLPAGSIRIVTGIVMAPGSTLDGQGSSTGGTFLDYTGSGTALSVSGTNGTDISYGARISNIQLNGSSSAAGLISFTDLHRPIVQDCVLANATNGFAIQLRNAVLYTEDARLESNIIRSCRYHYLFTQAGGTNSYAKTQVIGGISVMTGINDRVIKADASSFIYRASFDIGINVEIPAATTPTTTKAAIIELGSGATMLATQFQIYSELGDDRNFWRFLFADNARLDGFGTILTAPSTTMSQDLNGTHPWDSMDVGAVAYVDNAGHVNTGAANVTNQSNLGPGQRIDGQVAVPSTISTAVAGLVDGLYEFELRYAGVGRAHVMKLLVGTAQGAQDASTSSKVTVLLDSPSFGQRVFTAASPPIVGFSSVNHNAYLFVDMTNTVASGKLYVSCKLVTPLTTGLTTTDFGQFRPVVLFPDMSGITIAGATTSAATVVATTNLPTNNYVPTYSSSTGNVTWQATGSGSGNVTNNATLSAGNVTIGGGTTVIGTSNMTWNATNNTLTTPELVVTNNSTFGNITTTNLTISGSITGVMPLINGGTGFSSTTAGNIIIGNNTTTYGQLGVGSNGTVLTSNTSAALKVSWETPSGGAALTANYAGYGNATNILTGETAYQYNPTSNILTVGGVSLGAGSEVSTIGPLVDAVDGATPLNNINQVVASGTAYTMTATYGSLDFGTTDPVLTIANAGTYAIYVDVQFNLVGATYATYDSASIKLRRTNNTAADLTGSTFGTFIPTITTITAVGPYLHIGPIKYVTTNTNDLVTVQGVLGSTPSVGSVTATACTITAIRAY